MYILSYNCQWNTKYKQQVEKVILDAIQMYNVDIICLQEASKVLDIIYKLPGYVGMWNKSDKEDMLTLWKSSLSTTGANCGEFVKGYPIAVVHFKDFVLVNLHASHEKDTRLIESKIKDTIQSKIKGIKKVEGLPNRIILCGDFNRDLTIEQPITFTINDKQYLFQVNTNDKRRTCCDEKGNVYIYNFDFILDSEMATTRILLRSSKPASDHIAIIAKL